LKLKKKAYFNINEILIQNVFDVGGCTICRFLLMNKIWVNSKSFHQFFELHPIKFGKADVAVESKQPN
jgi:hypothetical protein